MGYSRIFQMSETPLKEEDFFKEERYYGGLRSWFYNEVACGIEVNELSIDPSNHNWFPCEEGGFVYNSSDNTLVILSKCAVLEKSLEKFIAELQGLVVSFCLAKSKEEAFAKSMDLDMALFRLKEAYSPKYGDYVDLGDEHDLLTWNDFVRICEEGKTYYLGAVFDYHY